MKTSIPTVSVPKAASQPTTSQKSVTNTSTSSSSSSPVSTIKGMSKSQLSDPPSGMSGIMASKGDLSTFNEKSVSRLKLS